MTTPESSPQSPNELAGEFVAYLDGEADTATTRQIEELLARDDLARDRLRSLEVVWNALDALPRSQVSGKFTHTTVELLALGEASLLADSKTTDRSRQWAFYVALASVALAAASVGFSLAKRVQLENNEALIRNLPAVESLDAYRQVDELEFLLRLEREKLFVEKVDDEVPE